MQRDNIHILSTRIIDESTAAKVADDNIKIDSFSFIDVQTVVTGSLEDTLRSLSVKSLYSVFTSTNAINAVASYIGSTTNWKVFCTGGRTRELAVQVFGEKNIAGFAKNAGQLAERIAGCSCIENVTFFCGDQRLNELPETLKTHGIATEEIIVYTTVQTPVSIDKNYDGILFFSPSAVHSFFSLNTIPTDMVLFSIGQTTTATIQSYCTNPVVTSEWPGTNNLLNCVTDFYNKTPEAERTIS